MLHSSVILQKALESRINLDTSSTVEILKVYINSLKDIERSLDISDNSEITKEEINILEADLRRIILTLHDLRDNVDNLNTSNKPSIARNQQLFVNSLLRTIERVKGKIRDALDELSIASNMKDAGKNRSFLKCFRNFQARLSEASSTFILLEIHVTQVNSNPSISKVISSNLNQRLHYNSEAIRMLLTDCFDDIGLTTFCYDHFPPVHDRFTNTMDRLAKIQYLISYCFQNLSVDKLLIEMEKRCPEKYSEHISSLINISL